MSNVTRHATPQEEAEAYVKVNEPTPRHIIRPPTAHVEANKIFDHLMTEQEAVAPKTRALLMTVRQALIMVLGALELYLGLPRSIEPKRKRAD